MNKDLFLSCQRIEITGTSYIVLSIPVPGVALCIRELDVDGGADMLYPVVVEIPQEPAA